MHYVQLDDNSLIISTSNGSKTINRHTFNYNLIKSELKKSAKEKTILKLLIPPPTPDGVFLAYLTEGKILIKHKLPDSSSVNFFFLDSTDIFDEYPPAALERKYLGIYVSINDIRIDWPEYVI